MRLTVSHVTEYNFDPPMRSVVQSHRLTPTQFDGQRVIDWSAGVPDVPASSCFRDGAGDWVSTMTLAGPVSQIRVVVEGTVETHDTAGVLRGLRESVPHLSYCEPTLATEADVALWELARDTLSAAGEGDSLERAHLLSAAVSDNIAYTPGTTESQTTAAQALAQGQGVCQDQAHALIAMAQAMGTPARYVTGYLHSTQDGGAMEASHAWAELWVDRLGWVGFDPANRCSPDERYIRLGSGVDAFAAAPIRGVSHGIGTERLDVCVSVIDSQHQQ